MDELIPIISIIFVIGVPVTSLAVHFVLRPLVKDIISAIRADKASPEIERRLRELEEGQHNIQLKLSQLVEAERFRHELDSGSEQR